MKIPRKFQVHKQKGKQVDAFSLQGRIMKVHDRETEIFLYFKHFSAMFQFETLGSGIIKNKPLI